MATVDGGHSELCLCPGFKCSLIIADECVLLNVQAGLEPSLLGEFRQRFAADAKNRLAQNVCMKHDLLEVLRVSELELTQHVFNHKVHLKVTIVYNIYLYI